MRNSDVGRTLAETVARYECRICGADHGTERHTDCPNCDQRPYDYYDGPWASTGEFGDKKPDNARFPFRTDSTWSSIMVEILK